MQYALFTAAPSLIFNENESEAVRDRHASLQWAVLCFRIVLLMKHWKKYLSKKFQWTTEVSNLGALFSFLQRKHGKSIPHNLY